MTEEQKIAELKKHENDREYVLKQVSEQGALLEFASDELRNDKEVVLEAVKNNPEAIEFASDNLKGDREVVYSSVSKVRVDVLLCERKFTK